MPTTMRLCHCYHLMSSEMKKSGNSDSGALCVFWCMGHKNVGFIRTKQFGVSKYPRSFQVLIFIAGMHVFGSLHQFIYQGKQEDPEK